MSRASDEEILARIDPARRDKAFQLDMLAIDEQFNERWLQTMRDLIAQELGEPDFTIQRMTALKTWTRDRKRAQARLHWKYDRSGRRPAALVERDIERSSSTLEERVKQLRAKLDERAAELATVQAQRRQRTERIREDLNATSDASAALHETERAQSSDEAARLRDRALDLVRQKTALPPGTEVTGAHISLFFNTTRDQMTPQDRDLFLRTIRGDIS